MAKHISNLPFGDEVIERIAKNNLLPDIELTKDLYLDLIEDVVSQQLSGKVAAVIFNRFLDLFPNRYPKAEHLCSKTVEDLRSVGLSNSKALYVKNIAEYSLTEDLSVKRINALSDEEIIDLLCIIKGVGVWTAQMVLIFSLNRPDVFPAGDLAIQQGMKHLYSLKSNGKELINDIISISEYWKPFRTTGTRYIWQHVNQLKTQKTRY